MPMGPLSTCVTFVIPYAPSLKKQLVLVGFLRGLHPSNAMLTGEIRRFDKKIWDGICFSDGSFVPDEQQERSVHHHEHGAAVVPERAGHRGENTERGQENGGQVDDK